MYVPARLKENDLARTADLVRANAFASLVTWMGTRPVAGHALFE